MSEIKKGDVVVIKRGWWKNKTVVVGSGIELRPPMGKWWWVEEFHTFWPERDLELLGENK